MHIHPFFSYLSPEAAVRPTVNLIFFLRLFADVLALPVYVAAEIFSPNIAELDVAPLMDAVEIDMSKAVISIDKCNVLASHLVYVIQDSKLPKFIVDNVMFPALFAEFLLFALMHKPNWKEAFKSADIISIESTSTADVEIQPLPLDDLRSDYLEVVAVLKILLAQEEKEMGKGFVLVSSILMGIMSRSDSKSKT